MLVQAFLGGIGGGRLQILQGTHVKWIGLHTWEAHDDGTYGQSWEGWTIIPRLGFRVQNF